MRRRRHRHLQAKAEAPAAVMAELAAWLAAWPEAAARFFVDEATVRRHPTLTAPWGVGDASPAVPTGEDQTTVPGDGAVAPLTGRPHDQMSPEVGHGELARFLPHLLTCDPRQRWLGIHARGAQHNGVGIEEVVRTADGRLLRTPQPAYSPELNPHERIWKWRRRVVTHHHGFATLREQLEAMRNFFRYLAGVTHQVVQRCGFKTPESIVASL